MKIKDPDQGSTMITEKNMKELEWTLRAAEHARVRLTDEEAARLAQEMKDLLSASEWSRSEANGASARAVVAEDVLRTDGVGESLPAEQLLSAASERTEHFFSVPRAVEDRHEA